MQDLIRVFIGYDRHETVAYHVLAHSIMEQASAPVAITPVMLSQLHNCYARPEDALASTEFSFSRFLVPYLAGYDGWAIFMDCDMLCRDDIAKLWAQRTADYAVQVVKHEHKPVASTKFNNHTQTRYAKKNWSSVMLMNCGRCRALTPEYVNHASGLQLHQFKWLQHDSEIGELQPEWNHLVGYDPYDPAARLVHFTEGGPYFSAYRDCDYADDWFAAQRRAQAVIEKPADANEAPSTRPCPPAHPRVGKLTRKNETSVTPGPL